jgi:hypothetical protein
MHALRRSSRYLTTAIVALAACGEPEIPAALDASMGTPDSGVSTEDAATLRDPCVMAHMYLVEGDQLTYYCGHEFELDRRWRGEFQTGRCIRPFATEVSYSALLALHYRQGGRAELWRGNTPVIVTPIEPSYYTTRHTDVRAYESPEGDRAELHVLSRAACFAPPAGPLTRASVEALEQ